MIDRRTLRDRSSDPSRRPRAPVQRLPAARPGVPSPDQSPGEMINGDSTSAGVGSARPNRSTATPGGQTRIRSPERLEQQPGACAFSGGEEQIRGDDGLSSVGAVARCGRRQGTGSSPRRQHKAKPERRLETRRPACCTSTRAPGRGRSARREARPAGQVAIARYAQPRDRQACRAAAGRAASRLSGSRAPMSSCRTSHGRPRSMLTA